MFIVTCPRSGTTLLQRIVDAHPDIAAVFDLHGRAKYKSLVGDKTLAYVRSIPTLQSFSSEARFVHLVRDGPDDPDT